MPNLDRDSSIVLKFFDATGKPVKVNGFKKVDFYCGNPYRTIDVLIREYMPDNAVRVLVDIEL